jgi:hypothetical protein
MKTANGIQLTGKEVLRLRPSLVQPALRSGRGIERIGNVIVNIISTDTNLIQYYTSLYVSLT